MGEVITIHQRLTLRERRLLKALDISKRTVEIYRGFLTPQSRRAAAAEEAWLRRSFEPPPAQAARFPLRKAG